MNVDSIIGAIISSVNEASKQFGDALRREYERGFADGQRQAAEELRARIVSAIGNDVVPSTSARLTSAEKETTMPKAPPIAHRAPRGSVEPAVMGAIAGSVKGKKIAEVAVETGVAENSVRGMLNKLRKDNRVIKDGERWYPAALFQTFTSGSSGSGNPGATNAGAD